MKTETLKVTYINPLTKTVETQDYINHESNASKEVQKEIHEYLEAKFGEEIICRISEMESVS